MIDENKVKKQIIIMKKSMSKLIKEKDREYIKNIKKFNVMVVLAVVEFRCQNQECLSKKNLQLHHLILRNAKKYMDYWRYASQRHYWANQIILCNKCHSQYHQELGSYPSEDSPCISEENIKKAKEFFKKRL